MSLLDEYKKLTEDGSVDNDFPENMEHEGLTEDDRVLYEDVLNKMRADMDKANEEMMKSTKSWGDVCEEVDGRIQNKSYRLNEEMLMNKLNQGTIQSAASKSEGGRMHGVSEPIGLFVEGFRCPKCGRLMYEEDGQFVCSNCGYSENGNGLHMCFSFVDKTYTKTPLAPEDNELFVGMFRRVNEKNGKR